jgi:hypothetical protein
MLEQIDDASPCSALIAIASPKPKDQASNMPLSPAFPSALLAARTTGVVSLRSQRAISSSSGVTPGPASMMNRATSASRTAATVCARMRPGSVAGSSSS